MQTPQFLTVWEESQICKDGKWSDSHLLVALLSCGRDTWADEAEKGTVFGPCPKNCTRNLFKWIMESLGCYFYVSCCCHLKLLLKCCLVTKLAIHLLILVLKNTPKSNDFENKIRNVKTKHIRPPLWVSHPLPPHLLVWEHFHEDTMWH